MLMHRYSLLVSFWLAVPLSAIVAQQPINACPDPGPDSRNQLLGTWAQDNTGPVLTHRRRYEFMADSTFEYVITSRPTGSLAEKVLHRERGHFSMREGCLVLLPVSGAPTTVSWRVARDPYVGDLQLVLSRPDGTSDVFYRR